MDFKTINPILLAIVLAFAGVTFSGVSNPPMASSQASTGLASESTLASLRNDLWDANVPGHLIYTEPNSSLAIYAYAAAAEGIQTNTTGLTNSTTGSYFRQDGGATIAKETGGNLDNIVIEANGIRGVITNSTTGAYVRQDGGATMAKETGGNLANAVLEANAIRTEVKAMRGALAPSGLTFSRIALSQTSIGYSNLGGASNKTIRLHALHVSLDAAGTVQVVDANSSAGLDPVALSGAQPLALGVPLPIQFNPNPDGALVISTSGHYMGIITTGTGALAKGYAVISSD